MCRVGLRVYGCVVVYGGLTSGEVEVVVGN